MSARNKAETLASVMKETIVTQKQLRSSKVKSGDNDVEEMIVDDVNEEWIESRKAAKKKHHNSMKKETSKESCTSCDICAKNVVTNDQLRNTQG